MQVSAAAGGTLAVRGYFFVTQPLTAYGYLMVLWQTSDGFSIGVGGNDSDNWLISQNGGTNDHPAVTSPTLSSWHCVEFDVDFPSQTDAGSLQLFVDDVSVVNAVPVTQAFAIDDVQIGLPRASGGNDVFLDDVVFAHQRIGCVAP